MKGLYRKILLFLLPVFLVWALTEVFYRTADTNYTSKAEHIVKGYPDTELLVFGDSHTLYGINPSHFEMKTFNIANVSQSLYFDELLLQKHLKEHKQLKAVLLNISYFTLSRIDNEQEDAWRKYYYDQQMDLDVPIVSEWSPKKHSLALARRFNRSFALMHDYVRLGTVLDCTDNGYGIQEASDIIGDKDAITPVIVKKHEDFSQEFDHNLARLQSMIALCEKHNVEVFIVEMPVYKAYFEQLNTEKRDKITAICEDLEASFEHVHYFNLLQDARFVDSDLRDADHLTNAGATKCSKLLSVKISAILQKKE
ncbi:MAG: hypothetical protein ACI86C_000654 [Candidatus Latescibacterota bacterium]|jgi:hypothetical protein